MRHWQVSMLMISEGCGNVDGVFKSMFCFDIGVAK